MKIYIVSSEFTVFTPSTGYTGSEIWINTRPSEENNYLKNTVSPRKTSQSRKPPYIVF